MNPFVTLHQLRWHLGLAGNDTADDDRLRAALAAACDQIERLAGRRFTPSWAARRHDPAAPDELLLDDDLLELAVLTGGDGVGLSLASVGRLPAAGPAGVLRLARGQTWPGDWRASGVIVTGVWGWHPAWEQAWRASQDSTQAALTADAPALAVADAGGADAAGETPRFQAGQLLRIEDEYLRVRAVDAVAGQLTVARGAQGTAAAAHPQGAAILIYQPPAEAAALALRWAAWLYQEPDVAAVPPGDLLAALASLRRVRVQA